MVGSPRLRFRCDYHLNRHGEVAQAGSGAMRWLVGELLFCGIHGFHKENNRGVLDVGFI